MFYSVIISFAYFKYFCLAWCFYFENHTCFNLTAAAASCMWARQSDSCELETCFYPPGDEMWRFQSESLEEKIRKGKTKKVQRPEEDFSALPDKKKEEKWSVSWAAVSLVSLCLFFCCWSNLKHTNKLKQPFFNGLDIYANFNFILKEK